MIMNWIMIAADLWTEKYHLHIVYRGNGLGQTRSENPSTHTPANAHLYDPGTVVVNKKLGRKYTVPTGSWTRDLWCANLLRYPLAHSCF